MASKDDKMVSQLLALAAYMAIRNEWTEQQFVDEALGWYGDEEKEVSDATGKDV